MLCTITLFSVLFAVCLNIQLKTSKLKKYNESIMRYSLCMEYIKNNMIYNFSYSDIQSLKNQGKCYCPIAKYKLDDFTGRNLNDLFTQNKPKDKPYLIMQVEGDKVYKVNLKLYTQIIKKERIMECGFYKGSYKK
ncbi:DNA helicase [Clostridium sp. P21]|uniref:DNA helicase n=1 Tax=Clostridium muellerianum TaxID=2716538 RepID=A0A7Y0EE08_9CLOT|nr:DNA helicase [Clostridium muellerianum]